MVTKVIIADRFDRVSPLVHLLIGNAFPLTKITFDNVILNGDLEV